MMADSEWFVPFSDPTERFVNQQRIRAGSGYRHSVGWRFEALFMWGRSRNTISESFKPSNTAIDLRVKHFF